MISTEAQRSASDYGAMLRLSVQAEQPLVPPINAFLTVSTRCNSHCAYCGIWRQQPPQLSTGDLLYAVDQFHALGVRSVGMTGGEPLLNRDVEAVIRRTSCYGMRSSLTTNGLTLTAARVGTLEDAGLDALNISLDTLDEETYAQIRGAPLRLALWGLENAITARRPGSRMLPQVSCVITRKNYRELPRLVEYCTERQVHIAFNPLHAAPGGNPETAGLVFQADDYDDLSGVIDALLAMQASGSLIGMDPEYLRRFPDYLIWDRLPANFECMAGYFMMAVDEHLNVRSCGRLEPVGNLREASLAEIWQSPLCQQRRSQMKRLACPKCWTNCHTQRGTEKWLKGFFAWLETGKLE